MRRSIRARTLMLGAALALPGCTKSRGVHSGAGGYAGAADYSGVAGYAGLTNASSSGAGATSRPKRRPAVLDAGVDTGEGPFKCRGIESVCNLLTRFPTRTDVSWGDGDDFHAGVRVFGSGLVRAPGEDTLHVTGKVTGPGSGFSLWFDDCTNLSRFGGVRFLLRGRIVGAPPRVDVLLPTNDTYPWRAEPSRQKGACASPNADPFVDCVSPAASVRLANAPVLLHFDEVSGGKPRAWDPTHGPQEILAVEFRFHWADGYQPYTVDVTLDDFGFIGHAPAECAVFP
jgi:hypothetical protein